MYFCSFPARNTTAEFSRVLPPYVMRTYCVSSSRLLVTVSKEALSHCQGGTLNLSCGLLGIYGNVNGTSLLAYTRTYQI